MATRTEVSIATDQLKPLTVLSFLGFASYVVNVFISMIL